nr:hypothetical protein [Tanacetum cinerariifolium]
MTRLILIGFMSVLVRGIEGFNNRCRRVVALDGCFLKSPNQENKDNWSWFLELLGADLDMPTGQGLTLMFDQHKGLIEVVKQVMPDAEHIGCKAVENGFSECFNSVLVSVRNKPLLAMLEAIRVIVIERMNTMRKIFATWIDDICPSILKRIDLMKNHTRFWHVIHIGGDSFEVRSGSDALKINKMLEEYVPNWYIKHLYYATYDNHLSLVGGINFWPDQSKFSKVLPPKPRIMPGRPKKKRIRESHEYGSGTRVSKKKARKPRKADATNVCGSANLLGGSANLLGGSANPLGGSGMNGSGVNRIDVRGSANPLGRSGVGRTAIGLGRSGMGRNATSL